MLDFWKSFQPCILSPYPSPEGLFSVFGIDEDASHPPPGGYGTDDRAVNTLRAGTACCSLETGQLRRSWPDGELAGVFSLLCNFLV